MDRDSLDFLTGITESIERNPLEKSPEFFNKEFYNPAIIKNKDDLLSSLGLPTISTSDYKYNPHIISPDRHFIKPAAKNLASSFAEEVKIHQWKLISNISSKLLSCDNTSALLECLIDRDEKIYEERQFPISLFKGYSLEAGNLFKICIYEKDNQMMIDIKDDPKLILESDFPTIDFYKKFKDLKLKKDLD